MMSNDQHALDLRRIPAADDRFLANLGAHLLAVGACDDRTIKGVLRDYAFSYRYWLGSVFAQDADWLSLSPEERFSSKAILRYGRLLLDRRDAHQARRELSLLRTIAKHLSNDINPSAFDPAVAMIDDEISRTVKSSKANERLSLPERNLPQDDYDRLQAVKKATREVVSYPYLSLAGFVRRHDRCLFALPGPARYTKDLLSAYAEDVAARLSLKSAAIELRRLHFALMTLWPEATFGWVNQLAAAYGPPKAPPEGLRALPPNEIPAADFEKLERAIWLHDIADRAAVQRQKRAGPAKVGRRADTVYHLHRTMTWFYRAAAYADAEWTALPLESKPTRAAVKAFAAVLEATFRPREVAKRLDQVRVVFERLGAIENAEDDDNQTFKRSDLDWLLDEARTLRRRDPNTRPKAPPVTTQHLVRSAEVDLNRLRTSIEINRCSNIPWRSLKALARDYRDAMLQFIQARLALRARNLTNGRRGKNWKKGSKSYHVIFSASEIKTKHDLYRIVPKSCTEHVDYLLNVVGPILTDGKQTDAIWISRRGDAMSQSGLQKSVPATSKRLTGHAISAKQFRTVAATGAVPRKNSEPRLGQRLLGHTNQNTTERHYEAGDDLTASNLLTSSTDAMVCRALQRALGRRPPLRDLR